MVDQERYRQRLYEIKESSEGDGWYLIDGAGWQSKIIARYRVAEQLRVILQQNSDWLGYPELYPPP